MPIHKAVEHYQGKNGRERLNCAQSVAAACGGEAGTISDLASCGGGRAPGGWCGAAHAAVQLTRDADTIENVFQEKAGAVTCREIRMNRRLSCVGCVQLGAELASRIPAGGSREGQGPL